MKSSEDLLEAFFAHLRTTTSGTLAIPVRTPVAGIAGIGDLVRVIRVAELRGYVRNVGQRVGRWFLDLTDAGAEVLGRG